MISQSLSSIIRQGGLFPIVKPTGITSAAVVDQLKPIIFTGQQKKRSKSKDRVKVGHGGTLDKFASGVLVIGLGDGTKLLGNMLHGNKKYSVVGCFGSATNTMEFTGKVTQTAPYDHIRQDDIENVLHQFKGSILQVPPIYSALKIKGQRMSDLASRGEHLEPTARQVEVYDLTCTAFQPPYIQLDIACGGGFYVRKLVHDVGLALGSCAHVTKLCRTQQGPFTLEHALKKQDWILDNIVKSLQDSKKCFEDANR